jgi:hypothetical protein
MYSHIELSRPFPREIIESETANLFKKRLDTGGTKYGKIINPIFSRIRLIFNPICRIRPIF